MNPRRLLPWLGLLFGAGGLLLQFGLSMQAYLANGRDLPGALGTFFSYYTILTNIVLVLIYLSVVTPIPLLDLFRKPLVRGMMAANIALVGLYVFFVLRYLTALDGPLQIADTILHYLCPTLYLLWWLVAQPHGKLAWRKIPLMLAPTLVYFVCIMVRGLWVQQYPYPILEANTLGYGQVGLNALAMTLGLTALLAVTVAIDHWLGREKVSHA